MDTLGALLAGGDRRRLQRRDFRHAPIHHERFSKGPQQNVLWFNVAMDDTATMSVAERITYALESPQEILKTAASEKPVLRPIHENP